MGHVALQPWVTLLFWYPAINGHVVHLCNLFEYQDVDVDEIYAYLIFKGVTVGCSKDRAPG